MSLQELEDIFYVENSKKKEDKTMTKFIIFVVVLIIVVIIIYALVNLMNQNNKGRRSPEKTMPNPIINCNSNSDCDGNVNHKICVDGRCMNEYLLKDRHHKNEHVLGEFLIDVDIKNGKRKYSENDLRIIEEYNKYVLNN